MRDDERDLSTLDPKVVVWDLDGTLWDGTLDAGNRGALRQGASLIPQLAHRGIVNTVCSNNTPEVAAAALRTVGLDDFVVFTQISWTDKSALMAKIVDFFRVSPQRIVLVDDDARIRARLAAQFGVIAVDPQQIESADLGRWGSPAGGLDRLERYRVLARRHHASLAFQRTSQNREATIEFLRSCATRTRRLRIRDHADRIAELSMRSNQLNLTRSRLSATDVRRLADTPAYVCSAIAVSDRFGDYGLCGFIAVNTREHRLEHFFWSCRVLNQGVVEHFAERIHIEHGVRLGHDALIDFPATVDWVTEEAGWTAPPPTVAACAPSMLMVGGCDLDIIAALMGGTGHALTVHGLAEVDGVQQYGHSGVAVLSARLRLPADAFAASAARLPWIGAVPDPRDWSAYEVVVLSLWVDYCCVTVQHRDDPHGVRAPSYRVVDDSFSDSDWAHWVGPSLSRDEVRRDLVFGPPLTAGEVVEHLHTLVDSLPPSVRLILLTAPEIDRPVNYVWGARQNIRNREINAAVREFASVTAGVSIIDIARIVTSADDLIGASEPTGFHYRRDAYARIAAALTAEVTGN